MKHAACLRSRAAKFMCVGMAGAAAQLFVFSILVERFHLQTMAGAALAVELAIVHNFAWHERFTWRNRRVSGAWPACLRLARFHAANGLISLAGNTILTYVFVQRCHFGPVLSAVASIAVCAPLNFLAAEWWVYGFGGGSG